MRLLSVTQALLEHERVDAAELEQEVEDAELCCQKEVLRSRREVHLAVVTEVRHHVDDRGGDECHDQCLKGEEPRVGVWERGVLDDHTDIAQKDNGGDDGDEENVRQNEARGDAPDRELEGDFRGENEAAKDCGQGAAEGKADDRGEEERVRIGEGCGLFGGHLWCDPYTLRILYCGSRSVAGFMSVLSER